MTNLSNARGYFTLGSGAKTDAAGVFENTTGASSAEVGRFVPGSQLLASATGVWGFDVVVPPIVYLYVEEDYVDPDYVE